MPYWAMEYCLIDDKKPASIELVLMDLSHDLKQIGHLADGGFTSS